MSITTIFFDLDDTLYPKDSGVWQAMLERIEQYMHEQVGIAREQVPAVRKGYLERFGTSLRGLRHEYNIDADEYLRYTHDIPIEELIGPNLPLQALLQQLPQRKLIFTNSASFHAERVLKALGIQQHFTGIIDVREMQFRSKPDPFAYQLALQRAGVADAAQAMFVDDLPVNLLPARQLGAATVLAGSPAAHPDADAYIERPELLLEAWPGLVESVHG